MNIDWKKLINGFNGFEKLAVEFVGENEPQNQCKWTHTKDTRDGNHDAILSKEVLEKAKPDYAIFVGYANNADVWWMEAKYSAYTSPKNKIISRYRLDATIVSAILSRNISKIVFVTNLEIASKTIADIREALLCSNSCKEVKFYTKSHIENWLLNKPYIFFKSWFKYSYNEYKNLEKPLFNCIEELCFYTIGNNLFQEALSSVYTGIIYEIHFSISVQKDLDAMLNRCTNIQLLSEGDGILHLKKGINNFVFKAFIPDNLEYEPISKLDVLGEYKTILPISITYLLGNNSNKYTLNIIPSTAIKIINSTNMFFDISSQCKLVNKLCDELLNYQRNPDITFSLISIFGKSGIGKTHVLQLFKNKIIKEKQTLICNTYAFCGDKIEDIKVIKKVIFQLFFPYLFFEDIDLDYVNKLRLQFQNIKNTFWEFIAVSTQIEDFMNYSKNPKLLKDILPNNISINERIVILDNIDKVSTEYKIILNEILITLIEYEYPIFCIVTSNYKIDIEKYRISKKQFLNSYELNITSDDVCMLINKQNINININTRDITILFGSVIEVLYFVKYLATLGETINGISDFKLAYHSFVQCDLLKNEIISRFEKIFSKNKDAESLCSCIYYTKSGIPRRLIYDINKSAEILDLLLDAELIRKNDADFFVCWHDYYRDIFISHFALKPYNDIHISFEDVYNIKLQLELKSIGDDTVEYVLTQIQRLFSEQKFYSIYYILENIFLSESIKNRFKNSTSIKNYFLLFAYFAYANTNAGILHSGYDVFEKLYTEAVPISDNTVIEIRYIILWEMINSLYENDRYEDALCKIYYFSQMPKKIQNNWEPLFDWELQTLKYAVGTVKMFIESEKGVDCLNKVPTKEFLFQKDIPFSTYRLLLCNLTNNFRMVQKILREYNDIIQDKEDCDLKTKYMYNFAVTFLDCINNNTDIREVIAANKMLKENFTNDYNRHIFAISLLALSKGEFQLCEQYRLEYIKTQRPMKVRQLAFEAAYLALVYLYTKQKEAALDELKKEIEFFSERETYLPVIKHNIEYVNQYKFMLDDLEFYLGEPLKDGKYYIDIRMLY